MKWGHEEESDFYWHYNFKTDHGITVQADFWLPKHNPPAIIECKTWGVAGAAKKRPSSSEKRKLQEALYSLIQLKRHTRDTLEAHFIVITGKNDFSAPHKSLLRAELGNIQILNISDKKRLHQLLI